MLDGEIEHVDAAPLISRSMAATDSASADCRSTLKSASVSLTALGPL
jgi:hypothetical protein